MNARYVIGLGLVGIGILATVLTGCHRRSGSDSTANILAGNPHRVVIISSSSPGVSNPCEVDFPVTLLKISKHHTIRWAAQDHDFWIVFPAENPIGSNNIKVPSGSKTDRFKITASDPYYFMYAIYDVDPVAHPGSAPCKTASDDRDTGLNVKR
jgi:hypothetical protein